MAYRGVRLEAHVAVEIPSQPTLRVTQPVSGVLRTRARADEPTLGAPKLTLPIATIVDEGSKRCVRDRRARDAKVLNFDRMAPLLVVEEKRCVFGSAELKAPAGNLDVACTALTTFSRGTQR